MKEYRDAELGSLVGRAEDPAPLDPGLEAQITGAVSRNSRVAVGGHMLILVAGRRPPRGRRRLALDAAARPDHERHPHGGALSRDAGAAAAAGRRYAGVGR